jgi:hypothetical protein
MKNTLALAALTAALTALAPATAGQTCTATEQQRRYADDLTTGDAFGGATSLSGDTLLVGAHSDDHSGFANAGSAYVLVRSGTSWVEEAKLFSSDPGLSYAFGNSVALEGDLAVVGEYRNDSVYVFERNGTSWSEKAVLQGGSRFGSGVALEGDTLIVGAGLDEEVSIYTGGGATWNLQQVVTLSNLSGELSISGDTFVARDTYSIVAYTRSGTTWSLEQTITGSGQAGGFGESSVILGDTLVVGAKSENTNTGAAYVYTRSGTEWTLASTLLASDGKKQDSFGSAVALSDDRIVVGATQVNVPLSGGGTSFDAGAVYSFVANGATWTEQVKLFASDAVNFDRLGSDLIVADDLVIANAPLSGKPSMSLTQCGSLYMFDVTAPQVPVAYCTAGVSASGCQALLGSTGVPSASAPSGFVVSAGDVEGDKSGMFFFSTNGRIATPWGSGTSLKCVALPAQRGALITSGGSSGVCDGSFAYDLNARWTEKPPQNPGAGALAQVQLWYRDPFNTSNQQTSLSDALEFSVCP